VAEEAALLVLEGWVLVVVKEDLEVLVVVETDVEVLEEGEEVVEADTVALDEVVDLVKVEVLDEAAPTESENIPMLALLSLSPE
jgi:hypothetical protein